MVYNLRFSRFLISLVAVLVGMFASAYDFEQGGIYYKINPRARKNVLVTYSGSAPTYNTAESYSGEINIPEKVTNNNTTYNVTAIDGFAFCYTNITKIHIPETVTSVGWFAFRECTMLEEISLPGSLTEIKHNTFLDCTALTDAVLAEGIKSIPNYMFRGCKALKNIQLPQSLTEIGEGAFFLCYSLESLAIPESVASIGTSSFEDCTNLTEINIPSSLTTIQKYTFEGCSSLKEILIPEGVTAINMGAFKDCINCRLIVLKSATPPAAEEISEKFAGTFDLDHYKNTSLNIPAEGIEAYKAAPVWQNFFIHQDNPLTGIENVRADGASEVVARYDLSGRPVADDYRGITIVRRADGSVAKEIHR